MASSVVNTAPSSQPAKPRRRWYQFTLRTAGLWIALFCLLLGSFAWWRDRAERQRKVVEELRGLGAVVDYQYFSLTREPSNDYVVPYFGEFFLCTWLRSLLGDDFVYDVNSVGWIRPEFALVQIPQEKTLAQLELVKSLPRLKGLELDGDAIRGKDLDSLPCLDTLEELSLLSTRDRTPRTQRSGSLTDDDLAPLERAKHLRHLSLNNHPIGDASMFHLRNCLELQFLSLEKTNVGDKGLEHISEMTKLAYLRLNETQVTDDGLKCLHKLNNLGTLLLNGTSITGEGLAKIGPKPFLAIFIADSTRFTDRSLRHMRQFPNLQALMLSKTGVTGTGLDSLKNHKELGAVYLEACPFTDESLGDFNVPDGWKSLSLAKTGITDQGILRLKFPNSMTALDLRYTSVTDASLDYLDQLTNLTSLNIAATSVTPEGVKRFHTKHPNCQVQ